VEVGELEAHASKLRAGEKATPAFGATRCALAESSGRRLGRPWRANSTEELFNLTPRPMRFRLSVSERLGVGMERLIEPRAALSALVSTPVGPMKIAQDPWEGWMRTEALPVHLKPCRGERESLRELLVIRCGGMAMPDSGSFQIEHAGRRGEQSIEPSSAILGAASLP
jgi:hypothetical protein